MPLTDTPRIQPHDLDAEQAILGAIALDRSALSQAQELITANDFYDSRHRRVFQAMAEIVDNNEAIDLLTVGNLLEQNGSIKAIGGRGNLAELLTTVASSSNIGHHCRIVHEHAIRRSLIDLAANLSRRAYDREALEDLLQDAWRLLGEVTSGRSAQSCCSMEDLAREIVEYVDRASKRNEALTGIPTGFEPLDSILGGWQRSDLVIVAARPSMGKTSLVLGSAYAAAKQGYRVGFFSVEMSRLPIGLRLCGMLASIDIFKLKTGKLSPQEWARLAEAAQAIERTPMWLDDASFLSVEQIAAKARHSKATKGLDLLIVDYLQLLLSQKAESRQQGIADISRKLKLLAKELDIPVIVLSQLSRECERRDDKRPVLADLRDSGAIEQDADVVMFLYRHEVYDRDTDEKGVAEVLIRKHRNGPIGDRRLKFVDRFARFEDTEP
ncbi:MAG: replicative DNA helicase [Nitrospira sp.]